MKVFRLKSLLLKHFGGKGEDKLLKSRITEYPVLEEIHEDCQS